MESSFPINFNAGTQSFSYANNTFNAGYFLDSASVTVGYLRQYYAQLSGVNLFTRDQYFGASLYFVDHLNDVARDTFELVNQLPTILSQLTNVSFFEDNHTTYIAENLVVDSLAVQEGVATQQLATQSVHTSKVVCQEIRGRDANFRGNVYGHLGAFDTLQFGNDVSVHLLVNGVTNYPVMKSGLLSRMLGSLTVSSLAVSVKPNFRVMLFDAQDILLLDVSNTYNDMIYNQSCGPTASYIKIYWNERLVV